MCQFCGSSVNMIQVLTLIIGLVVLCSNPAVSGLSISPYPYPTNPYNDVCLEELNLLFHYGEDTDEIVYNRTCLMKCNYEKEGKIDADGRLVLSKFTEEEGNFAAYCWNRIKVSDTCKRVDAVENCINSNMYNRGEHSEKCESLNAYIFDQPNNCYTRCKMIAEHNLNVDGSVNFSSISVYMNGGIDISEKDALDMCSKIVTDDDICTRDLNMYFCINHVLYHWNRKNLENGFECGRLHGAYPFYVVHDVHTIQEPNVCYDRCVMAKDGELNITLIIESNDLKNAFSSEEALHKAYDTCKEFNYETDNDECTTDLYFYDCIHYLAYTDQQYLEKEIKCAKETKSPLVAYRNQYKEPFCKSKCMMIQEGQLDEEGQFNRTHFSSLTYDDNIIENALQYCKERYGENTCEHHVSRYYCTQSKIKHDINKACIATETNNCSLDYNKNNYCYNRCLMIHSNQLDLDGNVRIETILENSDESNETIIKIVNKCKDINDDTDSCAKDVNIYHCASLEYWANKH